jgi:hypothetical protein
MSLEQVLREYFTKEAYGIKAPTGTPTTNYIHGPGGIFGVAGLDEQVISARIAPRGIAQMLTVNPTIYTDPQYPYITGYEESGSEPTGVCDTCISGVTQSCIQTAPLGRVCRESKEIEINRVFQRINPGEMDLQLVNDILGQDTTFVPTPSQGQTAINMMVAWAMVEIGMGLQNKLTPLVWQGNPTNNTTGGGYKEFIGLDTLIGTNKVDAITGTRCAALDSDVKQFAYKDIAYTNPNGTFRIVEYLNMVLKYVMHNAERSGMLPATWAIAMRPEMWHELLKVWPLAYYSSRDVVVPSGNTNFIDATRVAEMRNMMRDGMYLDTIAGRVPVVTDDGIFVHNSTNNANVPAGSFASTLYVVPLTYTGRNPATYWEYLDYRGAQADIRMLNETDKYWISDSGRFMWTQEDSKWCFTISGKIEPRLVLKTPQLAGKIENIMYTPVQPLRSYDQDSDYFLKGGVDSRDAPSLWTDSSYEQFLARQ